MAELYKDHRPVSLNQLHGQETTVKTIRNMIKKGIPHAILLTGPSGCGKTTGAYILKDKLNCSEQDFIQINAASSRGIDTIRDIQLHLSMAPSGGDCRVWLIDEAHKLTGDAQTSMLLMLEATPPHVYFFLATTNPEKLITTIKTRCTEIRFQAMTPPALTSTMNDILEKEGIEIDEEVIERIIESADGSARKALVILEQVIGFDDKDEQLNCILRTDSRREAILIARLLMDPKTRWPELAKIIKACEEDPEQIRWLVLSYFSTVILGGGKFAGRAAIILDCFRDNYFDTKKAGLILSCWEVLNRKK